MSESAKIRKPGAIVFVCGMIFSALVLRGVDWLFDHDINVMGFYVNGILPAGALLVGVGSGLGYALASRRMNAKLSKTFIWGMVVAGLGDYVAAEYVTYSNLLEKHHISADRYGFVQYIRDACEQMTFTRSSSSERCSPLGAFGYVFKFLEMAGFTFGYVLPSAFLSMRPYCGACQLYLKGYQTTYLNSPLQKGEFGKMKQAERVAALQRAIADLATRAQALASRIKGASFPDTQAALAAQEKTAAGNAVAKVSLGLSKCPNCDSHHVDMTLSHLTANKKPATKSMLKLDKTQAAPLAASAG